MQAFCGLMTRGDSVDNEARTRVHVAADKDIGILCLIGELVRNGVVAMPEGDLRALEQLAPLDSLTDGEDNFVRLDLNSLTLIVYGRELLCLRVNCAHALLEHNAPDLAALVDEDFLGTPRGIDFDVFLFRFGNFLAACGHFLARLEAEHTDLGSTETVSVSCAVDSDIAAADDNYAAVKCILAVLEAVAQILDRYMRAGRVVVLDSGTLAALAADGDIERLVALLLELRYSDILAYLNAALDFGAELLNNIDFGGDNILFELVARYTVGEHTAGNRVLFKDGGLVAHLREIVGSAQAGGAAADNGYLLVKFAVSRLDDFFGHEPVLRVQVEVGDEFLDRVYRYGSVNLAARALRFASLVADAAADGGERVLGLYHRESLTVLALMGEAQVGLNGHVCGAGRLARGGAGSVCV